MVNERPGDRSEIVYLFVVNGSLTCEGDVTITSDVTLSVYAADCFYCYGVGMSIGVDALTIVGKRENV